VKAPHRESHAIGSQSSPGSGDFPAFIPVEAGRLLDLATPEGFKAELTLVVITSQGNLYAEDDHVSEITGQCHRRDSNPRRESSSDVLTIRLPIRPTEAILLFC